MRTAKPKETPDTHTALRQQLLELLRGGQAHTTFDEAVKDYDLIFVDAPQLAAHRGERDADPHEPFRCRIHGKPFSAGSCTGSHRMRKPLWARCRYPGRLPRTVSSAAYGAAIQRSTAA